MARVTGGAAPRMTALSDLIAMRIRADGPMPISEFMRICLMHPEHGYYATRDPLGRGGDFITAPEISQMFGELAGLSLAQAWLDQGAPTRFALVEAGPGRGTLMADLLRATRAVAGFHAAAELHLIETSAALRDVQRNTLSGHPATWHEHHGTLPDLPLFLIANEFFDALPVRQYERAGRLWRERCVGLEGDRLRTGLGAPLPLGGLDHRLEDTRDGDVVEVSSESAAVAKAIGTRIAAHGGVALIFDYGDWRSLGDTLQAVKGHRTADPFEAPGTADLTAHVDFEALAHATPSAHSRLTAQGVFLERLGITARAQALARRLEGAALEAHVAAHRRLTHPEEMGTVFKVIAFHPETAAPPPGTTP